MKVEWEFLFRFHASNINAAAGMRKGSRKEEDEQKRGRRAFFSHLL
jgi:hypothetical protein